MNITRYQFTILGGTAAAAFHWIYVLIPYFAAGRWGAAGRRLAMFDFPIFSWLEIRPGYFIDPGLAGDIILFGLVGSLMYAAVGALPGLAIDKLRQRSPRHAQHKCEVGSAPGSRRRNRE
ncbi:MAG: hypothetical protein EHM35_02675 [Planctomycetaceae bacterium]|nr:MAG: hypothetical protein EHM35_02675 [Planctomycetaceae bacterium]